MTTDDPCPACGRKEYVMIETLNEGANARWLLGCDHCRIYWGKGETRESAIAEFGSRVAENYGFPVDTNVRDARL